MHDYTMQIAAWLEHRIENAEQTNAHLDELKQRVRDASKTVYMATGDALAPAMRAQDKAILDLVEYVAMSI